MASSLPFKGKVIAVTGGASGMGQELAHYLAIRGAFVSLADIQETSLLATKESVLKVAPEARVLTTVVDVRSAKQVNEWVSATVKEFGKLSGAANLAGVVGKSTGTMAGGVKELEDDEWKFILDVNLTGVFNCLRAQLKSMEKGGSIVNAASVAGLMGSPQNSAYAASKHGVVGLTRSAAKEEGDSEVRVNCICPGLIQTPMLSASSNCEEQKNNPAVFKRTGKPAEVAALISYLLGDESRFTTGCAYSIDGGWFC